MHLQILKKPTKKRFFKTFTFFTKFTTSIKDKMKDYLQSTNTKNAYAIGKEFELSYEDFEYIRYEFWPIIIFNDKTISEFETYLEVEKSNFINKHNFFDLDIFKREYLEIWLYDFNEYLDNIKKGQSRIWIKKKDVYFHRFKLKNDIKSYTMILTNKDSTGLEIYLKQVVKTINTFIKNNEDKTPKETPQPQKTEITSLEFTNNFDNVSEVDVYNHFKKIVEKKMLTDKKLNEYLTQAFEKTTPPKTLFKFQNTTTKAKLRSYFYDYYRVVAQRPHGKKEDYVKLLSDYFEGYPFETTKTNFSK